MEHGTITWAVEEERLNKKKYSLFYPETNRVFARCKAGAYCLQSADLTYEDIDFVISNDIINKLYYSKYYRKTELMNHHLAHACSSFFTSPYDEAAILVVDGSGSLIGGNHIEFETTSCYYASGNHIERIDVVSGKLRTPGLFDECYLHNSIGGFYRWITEGIGFEFLEDGKTMGLAPFGNDEFVGNLSKFYYIDREGRFQQSLGQVQAMISFIKLSLASAQGDDERFRMAASFAYAGQYHLELILLRVCEYLYKKTRSKNLCVVGGVALNGAANYRLMNDTPFENLYIVPAAGDAGTAIGSALYKHHIIDGHRRTTFRPFSPYLGRMYSLEECRRIIAMYTEWVEEEESEDIYRDTAELIASGNIVAWFHGRAEFGHRALGNRSILADPRRAEMRDVLNKRIKHREAFRPFAPSVLEERQADYFHVAVPSYYMEVISPVVQQKIAEIPAVVHVDGTARLQTVSEKMNPAFYRLLSAFTRLTDVPVLLNTSFNDNGVPIVETPEDAIQSFLAMDIDYLVLNGLLLHKRNRRGEAAG